MKNAKRLFQLIASTAFLVIPEILAAQQNDLTQFVDPLIGTTSSRWFFFTPGASPFGMAKPAPSTNAHYGPAHSYGVVGYDYRHTSIEGFANFHEFQVGGVVFAPTVGKLKTVPGRLEHCDEGYRSSFEHKDEYATAGYYSVLLKDYGVKAELTSTPRVAFHRYTFPAGNESHVLFDIGNKQGDSGGVLDAKVYMSNDGRIEGYVVTKPGYVHAYQPEANVTMYFSAMLDKKPTGYGVFNGSKIIADQKEASGQGAGFYLTFNTKEQESITIKAGLSYTSVANARLNLQQEADGLTFDAAHKKAKLAWNSYLHRIEVETANRENKVKFYTGLYHALLGRGLAIDVNGAYPKNDGSIGYISLDQNGKPIHNHYNTDAIWGGFWNLTQLWTIAYPEYYSDFIKSQLLIYKDSGWLADGIANSKYVSGVGTNFVGLVIASAYISGIRDFDITEGYSAALKNELDAVNRPKGAGKLDVGQFVRLGYVDQKTSSFSASHTLEYAYSCFAVGQWAKLLGKDSDYVKLNRLSKGWEQLFDPQLKMIRPKLANGNFLDNFKPSEAWRGFQEGNALQYSYYVPEDPQGLITKVGKTEFNSRLDSVFINSEKSGFGGGTTLDAFSGLSAPYNHGNQPCLHMAWLFNYSGKPSLTQKWVRDICNKFYGADGNHGYGYGQDEDQGQLGAWYVISSMGLFDVTGLTNIHSSFGIGSPLFDKVTIKLDKKYYSGREFVIETKNNSVNNLYIKNLSLNGRPLHTPFIPLADLLKGGKLTLQMDSNALDVY